MTMRCVSQVKMGGRLPAVARRPSKGVAARNAGGGVVEVGYNA